MSVYHAWPLKAPISNEFGLCQTLKKSTVSTSELDEGNEVEKRKKLIYLLYLPETMLSIPMNVTDISMVKYMQLIASFLIRKLMPGINEWSNFNTCVMEVGSENTYKSKIFP